MMLSPFPRFTDGTLLLPACLSCCRHDYNDYHLQLRVHVDERDSLLNKIDRATQRLHMLRNTNVYNDAFKIWCVHLP